MNEYVKKYQKIVNELIKKSFPELRDNEVKVIEFPRFFLFWSFAQKGFSKYYIFINKIRRKANIRFLKGQLSHELCHIVLDHMNKNILSDLYHNFKKFLSFIFNTKFSRRIETKIDKEVIKRGYGKDLLMQGQEWKKELSEKNLKNLYKRGYLKPKQIKSYAIKIKKW